MHFIKDLTEKTSIFAADELRLDRVRTWRLRYAKDVSGSTIIPHFRGSLDRRLWRTSGKQAEIRIPLERVIFDLQAQKFNCLQNSLRFQVD